MLGRRILWPGDRHELDLLELMLADHAARVFPCSSSLRPETRRPGSVTPRQRTLVEDFSGDEIGQRHFGGRDQPMIVGRAEQFIGKFRELADPKNRVITDQQRRRYLSIPELSRVKIEHELTQRPLEPSQGAA